MSTFDQHDTLSFDINLSLDFIEVFAVLWYVSLIILVVSTKIVDKK